MKLRYKIIEASCIQPPFRRQLYQMPFGSWMPIAAVGRASIWCGVAVLQFFIRRVELIRLIIDEIFTASINVRDIEALVASSAKFDTGDESCCMVMPGLRSFQCRRYNPGLLDDAQQYHREN